MDLQGWITSLNNLIHTNLVAVIGVLIAATFLGSKVFQRLGIPQVVGYISIGMLMGPSFLHFVPLELGDQLIFISEIALGVIGFDMGSHLLLSDLRKLGWCILTILIFEAFGTFLIVTTGIYLMTRSLHTAILFGAMSSATAPAATVDVLAEYDAKGPLTTSLLAVVGFDDALALVLFSVAAAFSESLLTGSHSLNLVALLELPFLEIGGSLLLGAGLGYSLHLLMRWMGKRHDVMAASIAFIFIGVGLSEILGLSLILTTMVMGMVVINCKSENNENIRHTIEQAGPVIYVLFFALVGARFQVELLPAMGMIGVVYIVLRSLGKISGAWIGGWVGKAQPVVRDNLGFGLFSQAGVAIGLAIASSVRFGRLGPEGKALGDLILGVITATTFVVQLFGPIFVKFAIRRAGEIGKGVPGSGAWASEGAPE